MRFVIHGAGAIGGVTAARLHEAGQETVIVARGDHLEAVQNKGLTLATREGRQTFQIPAVAHPSQLDLRGDDVVLLASKSQDTDVAVQQLAASAPPDLPIVSLQNGVANERTALRMFSDVYGAAVMVPATFLEPGVVAAHSWPLIGLLDLGRWPAGTDALARDLSVILQSAGFASRVLDDVARWKYRKLLDNLSNVVDGLCGPAARNGAITDLAREEGLRCLRAAGIKYASSSEDAERREGKLRVGDAAGEPRRGSSTWQSLARGTGRVETDYLNGEIVLLGRLYGVDTPVNALLQRLAREHAKHRRPPGTVDPNDLLARLEHSERN